MILMRCKNCLKFTILMRSRGPHQNPEFKAIFLQISTKIANFPLDLIKIMNLRQFFLQIATKIRGPHQNREFKAIFLQLKREFTNLLDLIKIVNLRQFCPLGPHQNREFKAIFVWRF